MHLDIIKDITLQIEILKITFLYYAKFFDIFDSDLPLSCGKYMKV